MSITENSLTKSDFKGQFDKYQKADDPNFINLENKQVVLVIKELNGVARTHKVFKLLEKSGVIIINDINQIKTLKTY